MQKVIDLIKLRVARRHAEKIVSKFGSVRNFIQSADRMTDGHLYQLTSIMDQLEDEEAWTVFKAWFESAEEEKKAAATFFLMAALADKRNKSLKHG